MEKVKIIIRDDDANYFTKPKDLEKVYSRIPNFPISYALVPNILTAGKLCPETKGNNHPKPIDGNKELVSYLKHKFEKGECDLLLHGLTHEYHYYNNRKISEMIWREDEDPLALCELIKRAKQQLEELFEVQIKCFVAPHNDLKKIGVRAVYRNNMNYSGIIPMSYDRDVSYKALSCYLKRVWVRIIDGFQYPGILNYGTHKELNACVAYGGDYLYRIYNYCKKNNEPMAINVHYWDMRDNPQKYNSFFEFVEFAIKDGAIPCRMRDVM